MNFRTIIALVLLLGLTTASDLPRLTGDFAVPASRTGMVTKSQSASDRSFNSRTDTTTIWFDDLEGDVSEYIMDAGWLLTEVSSYSPTHSFNADDDNYDQDLYLVSPAVTLPEVTSDNQYLKFSFALWCNTPDFDGDNDNTLEDYYRVQIANVSEIPLFFHQTTTDAYEGNSWWCADADIGGYDNDWLQALESPAFTVSGTNPVLNAKINYNLEEYTGDPQNIGGCMVDGWDAANVRISTDNGATWQVLSGTPAYPYSSCYGWASNGDDCNIAGWGASSGGWVDASFDLSAYATQSVKVRFYFGSDVSYSTGDGDPVTGIKVDNILATNDEADSLLWDNADDAAVMSPVSDSYIWTEVFYDYGDNTRPGGSDIGWQVYMPGDPFNGNAQLDITDLAGSDVRLRFQARFDDNDDGGNAGGLYIDDIHFWQVDFQEQPPDVTDLDAVAGDAEVMVTWSDLNTGGDFNGDVIYDDGSFEDAIGLSDGDEAYAGTHFDAPFGVSEVTVNSVDVFGYNGAVGTANLYAFNMSAGVPEDTPIYQTTINLLADQWVTQTVTDWVFDGDFLIAVGITQTISCPIDLSNPPSTQSWANLGGWDTWANIAAANELPDGEWGIRADVSSVGGLLATYNVYRSVGGGDFFLMFNGENLTEPEYHDQLVVNGTEYCYKVAAEFNDVESDLAGPVCAMPEAQTVYEIAYDDGADNTSTNAMADNYLAVRFTPLYYPSNLVRLKYYIPAGASPGVALAQVWDDDGTAGDPGTNLINGFIVQLNPGWNESNIASQNIEITEGSFYVGWQETVQTPPIGIDTDSPADNSYINVTGDWEPFGNYFSGALMIRVDMDAPSMSTDEGLSPDVPEAYALHQNYPNPFNPTTTIEFDIMAAGTVELALYDVTGKMVKSLVSRSMGAGHYQYHLNGADLASGIYFCHLNVSDDNRGVYSNTRKLMLIK